MMITERDPNDHRQNIKAEGVELVVRPNNRLGASRAGTKVRVDEAELRNHSTMSACMTLEEADALEAERERRRLAAEAAAKSRPRNGIVDAIEAGFDVIAKTALAKAKTKADAETFESESIAERAAALAAVADLDAQPSDAIEPKNIATKKKR
ncbi:MAG: hypothetical protein ABI445_13120 [Polyangia bacterium]